VARQGPGRCVWLPLHEALETFVRAASKTQGSEHIRSLHWYVASRLVVEGGFHPDCIIPRPPFMIESKKVAKRLRLYLQHDPPRGGTGERTVLGGLKTKKVDVVVAINGIGPCIAISMKGTLNAFRNLTNRMEEAVGDCTNLHITYPGLVYAFLHVLRANQEGPMPKHIQMEADERGIIKRSDVGLRADGTVSDSIRRYHDALARLTDRRDLRNDLTRYEAVALMLASCGEVSLGELVKTYPTPESPLRFDLFFETIYRQYDHRFIYAASGLEPQTRRLEWHPDSPALKGMSMDYAARVSTPEGIQDLDENAPTLEST
jgi:hypothetical protein